MTGPASRWVSERLGVQLDPAVQPLVGLALRDNPRRAHLLVSGVLGKHVPAEPAVVRAAGRSLGEAVHAALAGGEPAPAVVLGFAETATALGHCVAEALDAPCLHSTRRAVATVQAVAGFDEQHSHATAHRLLPEDPGPLLDATTILVLVDDELSTGATALNTITALHALAPRRRYVLAALVDLRSADDDARLADLAASLGARVDVVSLARGTITLPPGLSAAAARLLADTPPPTPPAGGVGEVLRHEGLWPVGVRESGRHGFGPADVEAARTAADAVAAALASAVGGGPLLVLGTEELMYAPLLVAEALASRVHWPVRLSSTTRSPVHVVDDDGYPIRSVLRFPSHDPAADGTGPRFGYNVRGFAEVVLVVDEAAAGPALDGLLGELRRVTPRVHVVVLPTHLPLPAPLRGPAFGSYAADEVSWLLTDLSDVALEAPVEEREEAIQRGGAHYAESLPIEYQPSAEYRELFEAALAGSARRLAHAVGVVTEIVLAERGEGAVLASLARAGTPIGILMRRWAARRHGLRLPHHTISIVRGRGLDVVAMRRLAHDHEPADVVFVDGWTGKGAIARELAAAVAEVNEALGTAFRADLAVLADPGSCVTTFGTREDFLIPSACLNSTVSGLVSRTVRNDRVLAPGQFDGAKHYRELAADDVSNRFLDAVSAHFDEVAPAVQRDWPVLQRSDRTPTWAGWAAVERLSDEYGIHDPTLVKPGVGETTRVLLRRVPWLVLARPGATLGHIRLLAAQRGVEVREVADLPYECVGLIHPRYTRGATGADGLVAGASR